MKSSSALENVIGVFESLFFKSVKSSYWISRKLVFPVTSGVVAKYCGEGCSVICLWSIAYHMLVSKKGLGWYWGIQGRYGRTKGPQYSREAGDGLGVEMKQWKGIKIASGT